MAGEVGALSTNIDQWLPNQLFHSIRAGNYYVNSIKLVGGPTIINAGC